MSATGNPPSNIKYIVVHLQQDDNGESKVFRTDLYTSSDIGYLTDLDRIAANNNPYRITASGTPTLQDINTANLNDPVIQFLGGETTSSVSNFIIEQDRQYNNNILAFKEHQRTKGTTVDTIIKSITTQTSWVGRAYKNVADVLYFFSRTSSDGKNETYNTDFVDALRDASNAGIDQHKLLAAWLVCTNAHMAAIIAMCKNANSLPDNSSKIKEVYEQAVQTADGVNYATILKITEAMYPLYSNQIKEKLTEFRNIKQPESGDMRGGGVYTRRRRRHRQSLRRTMKNIGL